ncbi:alpha/beta hydrolase [Emcibacter sp.]|uniref:alpha/beta fold hydrolase n=1 Tax=Emcibacter sp. TaxID=1979954 RepID=UPI002AA7F1D8|nr:alpha/beta hydrolase [Emcibacter sp.]
MSNNTNIKGPEKDETVSVWNDKINMRVRIAGSGPALIYFHPAAGLYWDEFLDRLAQDYTVYAPEVPGTTPGDPYSIHKVDSYTDLLLMYEELVRKLDLTGAIAVGQSMGGMIACDLASYFPTLFSRLIGLAPCGLWRDDAAPGLADLYAAAPDKIPGFLFKDPSLPGAQAMFTPPENPADIPMFVAQSVWNLGCAGKFLWPFPDTGLRSRLHRITIPALILWGREDRVMPSVYAEDFGSGISNCQVRVYEDCGHILQMEKLDDALADVRNFIS